MLICSKSFAKRIRCILNADVFLKRAVGANEVFMMTAAADEGGVDKTHHRRKSDCDGEILENWADCDTFRCLGVGANWGVGGWGRRHLMKDRRKCGAWSDTLGCLGSIPQRLPVVVEVVDKEDVNSDEDIR